jgi:hypothetical protein
MNGGVAAFTHTKGIIDQIDFNDTCRFPNVDELIVIFTELFRIIAELVADSEV